MRIVLNDEQIERYYNAKENKYKALYLSDTAHANIGIKWRYEGVKVLYGINGAR